MGLAIFWVAFFHIPWIDRAPWLDFIHDIGYIGVDVFVLLSGMGLCHSVCSRGREGYLIQRAKRIFPSLMPVVVIWSLVMLCLGVLNLEEFFGSVTLLGWWFGQSRQLNWYFSGVWLFFFLGVLLYKPIILGKRPVLWAIFMAWLSCLAMILSPYHYHAEVFTRVPVFLVGMLLGRLELSGQNRDKLLRGVLYCLIPVGLFLTIMTWGFWGEKWGLYTGLSWYCFLPLVPGGVFLTAEIAHLLKKCRLGRVILTPLSWMGEASAEILMLQVGIYKLIQLYTTLLAKWWILVMVGCLVLGVLYHRLVVKRFFLK